jgi:hypothetical protein
MHIVGQIGVLFLLGSGCSMAVVSLHVRFLPSLLVGWRTCRTAYTRQRIPTTRLVRYQQRTQVSSLARTLRSLRRLTHYHRQVDVDVLSGSTRDPELLNAASPTPNAPFQRDLGRFRGFVVPGALPITNG